VAAVSLAAPLAMGSLAGAQAAVLHLGWLAVGSPAADTVLLGLSLAVAAGGLALGAWQHRAIVRPLLLLAGPSGGGVAECPAAAREIAHLGRRLEAAGAAPDRDGLTELLSASGLQVTTAKMLDSSGAEGSGLLLVVVDIVRLRDINGLHGFSFGDELLRQFARRLTMVAGAPRAVARIGGDRFALLVGNTGGARSGGVLAAAASDALARPFHVAGSEVSVAVHAGAALSPTTPRASTA
jgi:diguanylate cyclase (GGDEF)-like protein